MDLNRVLENNKQLYVIAEVMLREHGKAVEFEPMLVAGSYEVAVKLSKKCNVDNIIVIPPFTRQENNNISPEATASFFRAYYG